MAHQLRGCWIWLHTHTGGSWSGVWAIGLQSLPELLREKRHERGKESERNGHAVVEHSRGNLLLFISHFVFVYVPFQNWLNAFLGKGGKKPIGKKKIKKG